MTDTATLERARTALDEHAWVEAYEGFTSLGDEPLSGEDLERLGEAAWWSAHPKESVDASEWAYAAHSAEATVIADDYAGLGVHEAARVGALAEGGEILATRSTIEGERVLFEVTAEREVSLKGLAKPSASWRSTGARRRSRISQRAGGGTRRRDRLER